MPDEITRSHRFGNDPLTGGYRRGLTTEGLKEHEQQRVLFHQRLSPSTSEERSEWNPPTRKCVWCNERFPYTSTARIYCSIKCRTLCSKSKDKIYQPPERPRDYSLPMHHLAIDVDLKEYSLIDDDSVWREQDPDVVKALRALPKKRWGPPPPP